MIVFWVFSLQSADLLLRCDVSRTEGGQQRPQVTAQNGVCVCVCSIYVVEGVEFDVIVPLDCSPAGTC